MNFSLPIWGFFLVFGRTSGLIAFFPLISEMPIPARVKIGITAWLSLAVVPLLAPTSFSPETVPELALAFGLEMLLGVTLAFVARLVFAGMMLGVQWVDSEIGFQAAHQINPLSGAPTSPVGGLMLVVIGLLFWSMGYFEDLLLLWVKIFQLMPPPLTHMPLLSGDVFLELSGRIFYHAMELATPILVSMLMVTLAIALFARAIQGVSIFVESYNVKLLVGLIALLGLSPLMVKLIIKNLERIPENWEILVRSMTTT